MSVSMSFMTQETARRDKKSAGSAKPCHDPADRAFFESVTLAGAAPAHEDDEARLVAGLREGKVAAFDAAYAAHSARVYSFLLRLSKRSDTAEDLAQETWLKLAKAAPSLTPDTRLRPLLFTIARHAFISHRRWAILDLSRIVTLGLETIAVVASTDPTPDVEHDHAQSIATLEQALARLPLASREVLLLVGVEGLDQDEVARILGLSYDVLRQRLHRARRDLKAHIHALETRRLRSEARS
jgi:RNA polymerase sigma-70 factor, ECF subfamily